MCESKATWLRSHEAERRRRSAEPVANGVGAAHSRIHALTAAQIAHVKGHDGDGQRTGEDVDDDDEV